jgi:hypothetical protein
MPPDLIALFQLAGSLSAGTIAIIMYTGFPRSETDFTLAVTLLLVYARLTLVPVVLLSRVTHVPPSGRSALLPFP